MDESAQTPQCYNWLSCRQSQGSDQHKLSGQIQDLETSPVE